MKFSNPTDPWASLGEEPRTRRSGRTLLATVLAEVLLLLLFGALAPVSAQDFQSEETRAFYQSYANLRAINDTSGIDRLVQQNVQVAEDTFELLCERYVRAPSDTTLSDCQPLATALDTRKKGTNFTKRVAYLGTLEPPQWQRRFEAFGILIPANQLFDDARAKKDQSSFRKALSNYEDALKIFEEIKDLEWLAFVRYRIGWIHDQLSEYYDAVVAYDKAMDEWVDSGRPKSDAGYADMVDRRRELIDRGYDPEGEPPDPTQAVRNTSTSFAAGSDWEDVFLEYKALKKQDTYWLPSPWWSTNYLFWHQVGYRFNSKNTVEYPNKCRPFDQDMVLVREGAKGGMDLNGDGQPDQEVKIIDGKPTLAEFARSKDKNADKYAMYLTSGLQTMQWLGQQVNYQELAFYNVGCYREGAWRGQQILLFDTNMTGSYGDPVEQRDGTLNGYPGYHDLDAMLVGKSKRAGPYSEYFVHEDKVFRLKPTDPVGRSLKVREMDVDLGQVKVVWEGPKAPSSLVLTEVREFTGGYFDVAGGEPVSVPVGRYQVAVGKIEAGSKSNPQLLWLLKGDSKSFDVKKGEVTVLEMGGPYTCEFLTEDEGKTFRVKSDSVVVKDRMGVIVGKFAPDILLLEGSVRVKGGAMLAKNEKLRLISSERFNENQQRAWFSEDLVVDKPANAECEAMLFLKKHDVLGGPIQSEWK